MKKPTVDERRAEILDGAIQVLIERGFANTRVADVAKRLDVSTSLIHYHFESKETLLAEAFAQAANQDIAELEADIDAAPTAVGKLDALIRNYVPEGSNDVEWMLWIDAWNEVGEIVGDRTDLPFVLPDHSCVTFSECRAWLQDSVYLGYDVDVSRGWWKGRPAVKVDRRRRTNR